MERDLTTPTAIRDVALFDGVNRLEHTNVTFDERVLAVGQPVPDSEVIDGAGHTVLPGLVDMHVHLKEEDRLALYLEHGVTTVKDVGNNLDRVVAWRRASAAGEIAAPRIHLCGPLLDGDPPMWPDHSVVVDAENAERTVDELARANVDALKLYVYLEPEATRTVIRRAHQRGLRVSAHLGRTKASDAVGFGLDGIEHVAQGFYADVVPPERVLDPDDRLRLGIAPFWAQFMAGWAAVDLESERVRRTVELVAENGTFVVPTLVVMERMLEAHGDPDSDLFRLVESWSDAEHATAAQGFENLVAFVGVLHEGGVTIVAGTDVSQGESLHRELEHFVEAGLAPSDALRCATSVAADALGPASQTGRIATGRPSDLVLVDGDPLEEISAVRNVRAVFKAGRRT